MVVRLPLDWTITHDFRGKDNHKFNFFVELEHRTKIMTSIVWRTIVKSSKNCRSNLQVIVGSHRIRLATHVRNFFFSTEIHCLTLRLFLVLRNSKSYNKVYEKMYVCVCRMACFEEVQLHFFFYLNSIFNGDKTATTYVLNLRNIQFNKYIILT